MRVSRWYGYKQILEENEKIKTGNIIIERKSRGKQIACQPFNAHVHTNQLRKYIEHHNNGLWKYSNGGRVPLSQIVIVQNKMSR